VIAVETCWAFLFCDNELDLNSLQLSSIDSQMYIGILRCFLFFKKFKLNRGLRLELATLRPKARYDSPKTAYGPPKATYGPPKASYGPPKATYGPPKVAKPTPASSYGDLGAHFEDSYPLYPPLANEPPAPAAMADDAEMTDDAEDAMTSAPLAAADEAQSVEPTPASLEVDDAGDAVVVQETPLEETPPADEVNGLDKLRFPFP